MGSLGVKRAVKKDFERLQLEQFLKRMEPLGYSRPSAIAASEQPDFILTTATGRVGVEVTAAVYSEYVRARQIHSEALAQDCIDTTHLRDREPRRSKDELLGEISSIGNDWQDVGEGMRDWRDKISLAVSRKRRKLEEGKYQIFPQNWLFVYDQPGLDNEVVTRRLACRHLSSLFTAMPAQEVDFHSIFLLSDKYLFRWHEKKLCFSYDHGAA